MFDTFPGQRLARFSDVLVRRREAAGPVVPVRRLLAPETLDGLLDRFAASQPASERRAVATQWSKHYLSRLVIPVTVVELACDLHLPTHIDAMGMVLNADGTPAQFILPHSGVLSLDNGCGRFCALIAHHLTPLIEALARHVRFSPRVLWSNAAVYFEFAINELAHQGLATDFEIRGARRMMQTRTLPDRRKNPFYRPVDYIERLDERHETFRWRCRRMCCLRYLDDALDLCGNCPIRKKTRAAVPESQV